MSVETTMGVEMMDEEKMIGGETMMDVGTMGVEKMMGRGDDDGRVSGLMQNLHLLPTPKEKAPSRPRCACTRKEHLDSEDRSTWNSTTELHVQFVNRPS